MSKFGFYPSPDYSSLNENGGDGENESLPSTDSRKLFMKNLPVQATPNDVREIVRFLRNKAVGISFTEVINYEPKRIFEPRKLEAYEAWGIIESREDRLYLTDLGHDLADAAATESELFVTVISSFPVYFEIIKWIYNQGRELVTQHDIIAFITQFQGNEAFIEISEAEAVSFFSLCHAAELGITIMGRRGQPARLKLDLKRIERFLARKDSADSSKKTNCSLDAAKSRIEKTDYHSKSAPVRRVYLSGGGGTEFLENLSQMLELAGFECAVSGEKKACDFLQFGKLQEMYLCQAGVILLSEDDCRESFNQALEIVNARLVEISVAAALFNWRVIVVWNSALSIPKILHESKLNVLVRTNESFATLYQTGILLRNMNVPER